ncbi:MAG: hypothetical protein CVU61_07235 [Deltaproteobacteria bacterium HGW-Deltaproteobacteria-19]|nr:MAG: hypothetical protein CVU61_07235 [Deltaproteobacteria bacterium HGW-Deltaproteobacteria-19]
MPAMIIPDVMLDDIGFHVFRRKNTLNDTIDDIDNDFHRLFHHCSSFLALCRIDRNLSESGY